MRVLTNILNKLDSLQQRHRLSGFMCAVVKKYSDDQVGYQAALLTYYMFLSLFPLLLVLSTLTQLIPVGRSHFQAGIIHGVTSYFPVLGGQLATHIHSLHKNGLALLTGLFAMLSSNDG